MKFGISGNRALAIFIGLTAISSIVWIFALTFIWVLIKWLGIRTDLWIMIEALSTAVAAAAVISAGFLAFVEISESAKSRYIEVADNLFEEMNSNENIDARRWVYQYLNDDPTKGIEELTKDGQAAIKLVLNSLDRVSFLTQSGWIPDEIIMPRMHPMIAKSWEKLALYVVYERERRHESYYYRYAEELALRCDNSRREIF